MTLRADSRDVINATRRVASLTPQQVEKKRAIDRENQRYFRTKRKNRLKVLEQQIAELTQQVRAAEAQVARYAGEEARSSQQVSRNQETETRSYWSSHGGVTAAGPSSSSTSYDHLAVTYHLRPDLSPQQEPSFSNYPLDLGTGITLASTATALGNHDEVGSLGLGLVGLIDLATHSTPGNGIFNMPAGMRTLATTHPWEPSFVTEPGQSGDAQPWQMVPLNIPPTTKTDQFILDTTTAWRSRALECGHDDSELSGPVFPSISSLLNPATPTPAAATISTSSTPTVHSYFYPPPPSMSRTYRPLSSVVAAQTHRTPLKTLPERLGFLYILSHLLRWLVCRTKESYDAMPEFLKPTELQRTVPHPAWIDVMILPQVRDDVIQNMDWARFKDLRGVAGACLSANWPFSDAAAVMQAPDRQSLMLHPAFEAHVRKRENWTMRREAADAFPVLKPYARD